MNTELTTCSHPAEHVTADVLEGDCPHNSIQWCRLCGAHRRICTRANTIGEWRLPENPVMITELRAVLVGSINASVQCIHAQRQRDRLILFLQDNLKEMSLPMLRNARKLLENLDDVDPSIPDQLPNPTK